MDLLAHIQFIRVVVVEPISEEGDRLVRVLSHIGILCCDDIITHDYLLHAVPVHEDRVKSQEANALFRLLVLHIVLDKERCQR